MQLFLSILEVHFADEKHFESFWKDFFLQLMIFTFTTAQYATFSSAMVSTLIQKSVFHPSAD